MSSASEGLNHVTMRGFSVIVATTPKGGIGLNGGLPWKLPGDLAHFKKITTAVHDTQEKKSNAVIMGRKTWESIPQKFRPLAGRINVVLTSDTDASKYPSDIVLATSLSVSLEMLQLRADVEDIFVIGGQAAYKEAVQSERCERVFVTRVGKDLECDAFFPSLDDKFQLCYVSKTNLHGDLCYDYVVYESKLAQSLSPGLRSLGSPNQFLHEEYQYLHAIRDVIASGDVSDDRTGVGTLSHFGKQMRYDLRQGFPLLTTKRVFWRGVVEELLWFIKGDTNANHLTEKGVKIWEGNGSREFLDKRGLGHREQGDLGPVYGFQWRHFGAKYVDMHTDYGGQGVDQLAEVIKTIKENPADRRILLSAWNPADLEQMALPPCHMFCQFYVANGELSCLMYQRSCDMGLGVPFNIASYALLTCMVAQVCGLKPGEFVHAMGNAHVYKNHVEPLKTQLERTPRPFPALKINPDVTDIDGFQLSDFDLAGYNPWGKIAMDMAV